jgi:hypothetical protein
VASALRAVLDATTLYEFAAAHPEAEPLIGRRTAYAVPLPGTAERVVVRHNQHGGLLAGVTRDLFRMPSRAPHELRIFQRLHQLAVPTPQMLGYVVYPAPGGLCRADVFTRVVPCSHDLSTSLLSDQATERAAALAVAARLVRTLSAARARHHDLNVKNILLHDDAAGNTAALVLDVDRVTFETDADVVREQNLARLLRSARKWQAQRGARVTDMELERLAELVRSGDISVS